METQLRDRVALVTGAARGIGRGIAEVLAERGARVVLSDVNEDAAKESAAAIAAAGGAATGTGGDVTDQASMDAVAAAVIDEFGRIDVLVANAGVIGAPGYETRRDFTEDDWDATFTVNVKGIAYTAKAVAPHMKERRSGRIINIASHGGRKPRGVPAVFGTVQAPYSVSKAAAIQWTHLLAMQLGPFNITVNAVCPGTLWTPMWEAIANNRLHTDESLRAQGLTARDVFDAAIRERTPLGREQTPRDIGKAVAFFASDDASEITGQALNVNGGAVMN